MLEQYKTVEGMCGGVPIYSFNNIVYVYGEGPELYPETTMQEGNDNPKVKFRLKKSSEIKNNFAGSEHEMTPRTPYNDTQPCLPIHLIDGDPDTIWCSWGG